MSSLNMGNTALLFNIILSIYILFSFTVTQSAPESALVTELPGFDGTFPSKHYSRYVPIVGTSEKKLFYYFVLSERNTLEDPVVLWLNGWPGCSSFDGFVYEHGPISFEKGKSQGSFLKLHLNPYSWSKDCEDYGLVEKVSRCLQSSGLLRDGGIATSLTNTGQQWDFPNGWAPLQHMIVEGLVKSGSKEARSLAEDIVVRWIRTNYAAYKETGT